MPIPPNDPKTGILPVGIHAATLQEIEAEFVTAAPAGIQTAQAVTFACIDAWVHATRALLGKGRFLIGGEFVSHGGPLPGADVVYQPLDGHSEQAMAAEPAMQLFDLTDVMYAGPGHGGWLDTRASVGGLVHAYYADEHTFETYARGIGAILDEHGFPVIRHGVLEVVTT